MAFLTEEQIKAMGFRHVGKNCLLSDKASYYNCKNISIGNNTRIDDFCVLSAGESGIIIGSYIHIAVYSSLIGAGKIVLNDFCNISSRVAIYSSNDDYSGEFMTNPMVPSQYTNVMSSDVIIGKHVIVGSGSVILPGVTLGTGVAVGALSLVNKSCSDFGIYIGTPAKKNKERKRTLLKLEIELKNDGSI
ncbi:acyltransferase [Acinetobacter sp. A1-4-2]|jgi:galactoside O-acetyltransferase|uniref:Chloramphenicol acetyltransferase n=1 Tax=Acinetobacter sp. A1-4-2 TaxID=3156489 RepID=A0AAU7SY32_9GAMM|nr:acyltransferase [Acinetobacter sp. ANC 4218]OTG69717.1 galactoside O-acetyltransferase [Acinetobacter sp. ANC 4218]